MVIKILLQCNGLKAVDEKYKAANYITGNYMALYTYRSILLKFKKDLQKNAHLFVNVQEYDLYHDRASIDDIRSSIYMYGTSIARY